MPYPECPNRLKVVSMVGHTCVVLLPAGALRCRKLDGAYGTAYTTHAPAAPAAQDRHTEAGLLAAGTPCSRTCRHATKAEAKAERT
jgi:hypothetical protein